MMDFRTVMQRIREILVAQEKKKKILDREIAYFAQEHQINMNWILLAQKPQYLT